MTKRKRNIVHDSGVAFNNLPLLPPNKDKVETVKILKQLVKSSIALAEFKGIVRILPNPEILLNAVVLKEAKARSEIENIITTQDKLHQALSVRGFQVDAATKEVLRYREAMLFGIDFIKKESYCKSEYLERRLSISRITASKYLKGLEGIGVLKSKKVWKEKLYVNTKLFDLLKKQSITSNSL